MDTGVLMALACGAVGFFMIILSAKLLKRIFIFELPDFVLFIFGAIAAAVLILKQNFFFNENPAAAGLIIGIMLGLLWEVKDAGLLVSLAKTIFSFRLICWAAAIYAGMHIKEELLGLWNKYIISNVGVTGNYLLLIAAVIFIIGSVLVLYPEVYLRGTAKDTGFRMVRKVPFSRRVSIQFTGALIVLINFPLAYEAVKFIYTNFR
jgi:hypothetical protein